MWAFSGLAHGTECTTPRRSNARALYITSSERGAMLAIQRHTASRDSGKSDGPEARLVPIAPTADFCPPLMEAGSGKCHRHPGPHGMNEKSLDDLRLLSQRRSTSYRGRTDMRLEEHFESSSTLQRNERVKLAASFWNNVGAAWSLAGWQGHFS